MRGVKTATAKQGGRGKRVKKTARAGAEGGQPNILWEGGLALAAVLVVAGACARSEPPQPRSNLRPPSAMEQGAFEASPGARRSVDPRTGTSASARVIEPGRPIPRGGGTYKVGQPYQISGRWYVPQHDPNYDRHGIASWYGDDFHGRKTANGEIYDMWALSAAHPTLPIPSYAWVTNEANGRTVLVRINDRGPYAHDRIIDLSRTTARALAFEGRGLARVRVKYAGMAPLDGDDRREWAHLRSQPWYGPQRAEAGPLRQPKRVRTANADGL